MPPRAPRQVLRAAALGEAAVEALDLVALRLCDHDVVEHLERRQVGDHVEAVLAGGVQGVVHQREAEQLLERLEVAGVVGGARRAAVLGSPIAHSRSPQLHLAAYRALGLDDWTYDRIECDAERLPALVGGFGPEWVGCR